MSRRVLVVDLGQRVKDSYECRLSKMSSVSGKQCDKLESVCRIKRLISRFFSGRRDAQGMVDNRYFLLCGAGQTRCRSVFWRVPLFSAVAGFWVFFSQGVFVHQHSSS